MENARGLLKQYFGYDDFRKGQKPLIDAVLDGRDVLAYGRREVSLLSDSCSDDARNHFGSLSADFSDEGSGGSVESGRDTCSFSEQFIEHGTV